MSEDEIETEVVAMSDEDDDDFGSFDNGSIEEEDEIKDTTTVFDRTNDEISSYVEGILNEMIPLTDGISSLPLVSTDELLDGRSKEILQRLTQPPAHVTILNDNTWRKSTIRREMLLNLGLPLNLDELNDAKKRSTSPESMNEEELNLPQYDTLNLTRLQFIDILKATTSHLDDLNIQKSEYYRSIHSVEKLQTVQLELQKELQHLKKLYVSWREYETNLQKDNTIFQDYVENMVGNELKFRNEDLLQQKLKSKLKKK